MLSSVRHFLSDVLHWLTERKRRLLYALAALVVVGAIGVAGYLLAGGGDEEPASTAPAPEVFVHRGPEPEATEDLGFPAFATNNTTRVAGADAIAHASAVALAVYPSTGGVPGPSAVSLVDAADWPSGIAAASLVAAPVGAPMLVTDGGEVPDLTANALRALAPSGSPSTDDHEAFVIGDAARPSGLEALTLQGTNPAEIADEVDRLRTQLAGEPQHLLLASSDDPEFAMPAASWAARSGDPVLFVQRDSVPGPTLDALRRHEGVPVYVLGPEAVVSAKAFRQVQQVAPNASRVGAQDPLSNSIAFARYTDGSFGWNINDPGHGLVIASSSRPLDGAVAAPLSASGMWGPLLVTEEGAVVPSTLRGYLLDLKPGYEDDPTRALYNHVWLIGDTETLSVGFQAQIDELAELAPIRSGR